MRMNVPRRTSITAGAYHGERVPRRTRSAANTYHGERVHRERILWRTRSTTNTNHGERVTRRTRQTRITANAFTANAYYGEHVLCRGSVPPVSLKATGQAQAMVKSQLGPDQATASRLNNELTRAL